MKPKLDPASRRTQGQLFEDDGPALSDFIDMKHPLVQMANSGRRVAALLMLKHMESLSDVRLMEVWVSNPYYQ